MTRRRLLLGLAALALPGVARAAPSGPLVFAASSLTESMTAVGAAWAARGHPAPVFTFDASSRLARQIEAGAPADLFVSADLAWMDALAGKGLLLDGTRLDLLGNALVVVVPAASTLRVGSPADLARPEVRRLALAGESVPAGAYARAALASAGAWDAVAARVVNGDHVRAVLGWVATGEADAGVVYATDARVEPRVRVAYVFPAASHPPIVYPAAVPKGAPHAAEAAAFLAFCAGPEGRAIFAAAGFPPPPPR